MDLNGSSTSRSTRSTGWSSSSSVCGSASPLMSSFMPVDGIECESAAEPSIALPGYGNGPARRAP
jgi:hypothetical protein